MSKVIFLDVDGVLNDIHTSSITPNGYIGLDKKFILQLKRIVDATNADIVLTSDWKFEFTTDSCDEDSAELDGKYLCLRLSQHDLHIKARTKDNSVGTDRQSRRGSGIRRYIQENKVTDFVILDDIFFEDFTDELKDHFVWTENTALNEEKANKAIAILNGTFL